MPASRQPNRYRKFLIRCRIVRHGRLRSSQSRCHRSQSRLFFVIRRTRGYSPSAMKTGIHAAGRTRGASASYHFHDNCRPKTALTVRGTKKKGARGWQAPSQWSKASRGSATTGTVVPALEGGTQKYGPAARAMLLLSDAIRRDRHRVGGMRDESAFLPAATAAIYGNLQEYKRAVFIVL